MIEVAYEAWNGAFLLLFMRLELSVFSDIGKSFFSNPDVENEVCVTFLAAGMLILANPLLVMRHMRRL